MKKWFIYAAAGMMAGAITTTALADDTTAPPTTPPSDDLVVPDSDTDTDADTDTDVKTGAAVPSAKVTQLSQQLGITEESVNEMLNSGMGNGEAVIAMSLANKLALASDPPLTIDDALNQILSARAAGQGWGQIAKDNGLNLGQVVSETQHTLKNDKPEDAGGSVGKANKPESPGKPDSVGKPDKPDKPEKVAKVDKPEKPSKPDKPEKVAKVDKPEKPAKPQKPEKPEKPHGRPGA